MDTLLGPKFKNCVKAVLKNHNTAFLLRHSSESNHASQLTLMEVDIETQTVSCSIPCLQFDDVQTIDNNYHLMYTNGFLVLVFPNQMVCIYQDNTYFNKRVLDEQCHGSNFYNSMLASPDGSNHLALVKVLQSQVKINCPLLIGTDLLFLTVRELNKAKVADQTFIIQVPLAEIDILNNKNQLFSMSDSKFAQARGIYCKRSPLNLPLSIPTDIVQLSNSRFCITHTCGTAWIVNSKDSSQYEQLLTMNEMRDFTIEEKKAVCLNSVDCLLVDRSQNKTILHPSQISNDVDSQSHTEFLLMGDYQGNLILLENRQPKYVEQFSDFQIHSVKLLSVDMSFAVITSDGVLKVCHFVPIRRNKASNNVYKIERLSSVQSFQELNKSLKLVQFNLMGSQILHINASSATRGSFTNNLLVLWPRRILRKVNKRLQEEKLYADSDLQIVKLYPVMNPMVSRLHSPIFFSNVMPQKFLDFVPGISRQGNGLSSRNQNPDEVELQCERFCYLIDESPVSNQQTGQTKKNACDIWISQYDYATDKVQQLVNISSESGIHSNDQITIVRLDMRPASFDGQPSVIKFLVSMEIRSSQTEMAGVVCNFVLNSKTNQLTENVLQLPGKTGIYLGKLDYKDPSILVLNTDMKSLIIFSFDEGDLERQLPHGEVRLQSKVNGVYWSPLRDGLAVVYEMQQDNLLTFSKNRLSKNQVKDFGILVNRNVGLKLHYEERVFDLRWTGFNLGFVSAEDSHVKGVVGTNQHIYFVDDKLGIQGVLKQSIPLTCIQWMGDHSVLYTTKDHLIHVYNEKHPQTGVLMSFNHCLEKQDSACESDFQNYHDSSDIPNFSVLVKSLSDRVILGSKNGMNKQLKIKTKPFFMLEPLLLGYLASTPRNSIQLNAIQNCIKYLDTNAISMKLIDALALHGLDKSKQYLIKNQPILSTKVGLSTDQILQLDNFNDFLASIFPHQDMSDPLIKTQIRKKLQLDPATQQQKHLLMCKTTLSMSQGQLQSAFTCADLLSDIDQQVAILRQQIGHPQEQARIIEEFLTEAAQLEPYEGVCKFQSAKYLTNRHDVRHMLQKHTEKKIEKLILAYDEFPFAYVCPNNTAHFSKIEENGNPDQDNSSDSFEDDKVYMDQVAAPNAENFSTFIGLRKIITDSKRQGLNRLDEQQNKGNFGDWDKNNESQLSDTNQQNQDSFDSMNEDFEEKNYLTAYWRGDEGQGTSISDVTDNQFNLVPKGQSKNSEFWSKEPLNQNEPLDYEDKWGKLNSPSYSIQALPDGFQAAKLKKKGLKKQQINTSVSERGDFTLEFWLKREDKDPSDIFIFQIYQSQESSKEVVSLDITNQCAQVNPNNDLFCRLSINSESLGDHQEEQKIPSSCQISSNNWSHLAIVQQKEKLTILSNFTILCTFIPMKPLLTSTSSIHSLTLFQAISGMVAIAETRLWRVALSAKQIKSIARRPLALLFEQRRNLTVQIHHNNQHVVRKQLIAEQNHNQDSQTKTDQSRTQEQDNTGQAKKKKGGLKLKSKFDTVGQSQQSVQQPDFTQVNLPQNNRADMLPDQEIGGCQISENKEGFGFWGFGMNNGDAAASANVQEDVKEGEMGKQGGFAFDDFGNSGLQGTGEEKMEVTEEKKMEAEQVQSDFFAFDGIEKGANNTVSLEKKEEVRQAEQSSLFQNFGFEGFDFNQPAQQSLLQGDSQPNQSVDQKEESSDVRNQPLSDQFQVFDKAVAEDACEPNQQIINDNKQESSQATDLFNFGTFDQPISQQLEPIPTQSEQAFQFTSSFDFQAPQNTNILDTTHLSQVEKVLQEEVKLESLPKVKKPQRKNFLDQLSEIEQSIIDSQLSLAEQQVQNTLRQVISDAQQVETQEEKNQMKVKVRQIVVMKLMSDISRRISDLGNEIQGSQNEFQKLNLVSKIASLTNVLIMLKLPKTLRLHFFKFSLKQNFKIQNFSAISKILQFLRKSAEIGDIDPISPKLNDKLQQYEHICQQNKNTNLQIYKGDDCPHCGTNLTFGLATPQCFKCKQKIAICYLSLKPVLKDKEMLKCHVCLAQFAAREINTAKKTCPLCQLVKLKIQ